MLHVSERKQLYAFLARLFSYPDRELAAALRQGEAAAAGRLLPAAPAPPSIDASTVELETAYTGLFINRLGGAPAPPYGSIYLERDECLMGQTSLLVAEAYRAEGLALEGSGEPPDFLPTELEFLYYLVEQEEQALSRRDLPAARKAVEQQAGFCRTLLHPWMQAFCGRIEADGQTHPLYRWAAGLLREFCRREQEWLEKVV
ncbi:MAG TPA: molecular chaperone TorD family protein [Desulfuromonadales bacterium]|nr:molecular chaperone TorD family protein [Desulfuromonadales bacterium]